MSTTTTDVIVVGAGLSGLTAARKLHEAGVSFVVLEARDRVGGKTLSHHTRNGVVELGAAWINEHTQPKIAALAREAGSELLVQYNEGKNILYAEGRREAFDAGHPPPDPLAKLHAEMEQLAVRMEAKLAQGEAALYDPEVADLDAQTVYSWYRARGASEAEIALNLEPMVNALYGAGAGEISFLIHCLGVHSNGGWEAMVEVNEKGAQYQHTSRGNQQMSEFLAAKFPDSVRLAHPVTAIKRTAEAVTAHTPSATFTARAMVVATDTCVLSSIEFSPPLPLRQRLAVERAFMGYYTKVVLFYEHAWWRERGLTGAAITPSAGENMHVTFDQVSGGTCALTAFLVGQKGAAWAVSAPEQERHRKVIEDVARVFDAPEAAHPLEVLELQWTDEQWSRGAPSAMYGPGQLAVASAFQQPTDNIFWAGTDNAHDHVGYMEGALQAGEMQAKNVLAFLKK